MKTLLKIVVVVLIVLGIWFLYNKTSKAPTATDVTNQALLTHPDPSNATFDFEDGALTLKDGVNEKQVDKSSAVVETSLTDIVGFGDLNNDKKEDAVVVLVQDGAGSGLFVYIAGFVSAPLKYFGTNAIFVGDRVEPKTITIKNGLISLTYLDRRTNEPMSAEPTLSITKTYIYSKGLLVEVK
ncbi:MAG: hypothetical protein WAV25_02535 [Minisyncoccia bacterium]